MAEEAKPGPSGEPKSPSRAGTKKPAKAAAAVHPRTEPTAAEHYLGKQFAKNAKLAFKAVEPVLIMLLVAVCISTMYPLYEEVTDKLSYFRTTPWLDAPAPRALEGVFAQNDALIAAEHLFEGKILGPESIVEHGGALLASTLAGTVVEVPRSGKGDLKPVFFTPAAVDGRDETTGHPLFEWCQQQAAAENHTAQHTCGRPLGMRVRGDDLYVLDAYFGLFKKPLGSAGAAEWLVRPEDCGPAEGPAAAPRKPAMRLSGPPARPHIGPCLTFDDLDVLADGSVVFTDASGVHPIRQYTVSIVNGDGDGRLLFYDAQTKTVRTIVKDLRFANGVQLTPAEDAVLFTETGRRRVLRCKLPAGPDGCTPEVLENNLPGVPDNLRASADGRTVLIALAGKCARPLCPLHEILTRPQVARFLGALLGRLLFSSVEEAEALVRRFNPRYGHVVEMTWEGRVVRTFHDATGRTPMISEPHESGDGFVYLGSPTNQFLARVSAKVIRRAVGAVQDQSKVEL